MADEEKNESDKEKEEPVEVQTEEEQSSKRRVLEIRPKNPSPEVNDDEPPKLTLGGVFSVIRKKGLLEALSDDAWGPHVHLVTILIIILMIAVGVAIIQFSTM